MAEPNPRPATSKGAWLARIGIVGPALPLVVFGLSSLIAQWDDSALGVLLPDMRAEFGLNLQFLVALNSALGILGLMLALPFGYAADRVKRIWLLRAGSLAANAGSIVQGVAPGVGTLVVGRIVAGAGTAAIPPASFSYLADSYQPSMRSRVFAITYVAGQSGIIIGPVVAGVLGARFGWRTAVVVLGVLATGVSLLTFALREPSRGELDGATAGDDAPLGIGDAWRTAFGIGTIRRLCWATPFITAKGAATGLLTIYFADTFVLGAGPRGLVLALYGAVGLVGLVLAAPIADRILSERPGAFFTLAGGLLAVQAAALVMLALSTNLALSIVVSVPIATIDVIFAPAFLALISQVVPARVRGLGLQVTTPFQLAGYALSILIVGSIAGAGLHAGIAVFALPTIAGAAILGTGSAVVARDLRTARARASLPVVPIGGDDRLLTVRGLEAGFDGVPVLFGVDLAVAAGEVVALVGTNGAGKSTLLRAIAGLGRVDAGVVAFAGSDLTIVPPYRRVELGIHLLAGGQTSFPDLTVGEHLAMASADSSPAIEAFPDLARWRDRRAGDLSGGEQQQLAVGQALLLRPRLLLVDELSIGLAPAVVGRLVEVLRVMRDAGTTIVIVEQSLNVALTIADRAVFLERGEVRFDGPVDELIGRPDLVRATFLGAGRPGRAQRTTAPPDDRRRALEVESIDVAFGGIVALAGVSMAAAAGEIVGIIGPNGAGKTTLFDVMSGFVHPETGRVCLQGDDITELPPDERGRRGLVRSFQRARLFPALSVRENVMVAMEKRAAANPVAAMLWTPAHRRREARLARRADDLLELLDLDGRAEDSVGTLSTGTRRVVDMACVLAAEPIVLLMDEPSSGLAQAEVEALGPLLVRVVRETGCALLAVEHDLPLISAVAHRLVAMDLGRVIASGSPDDVRTDPAVLSSYLTASDAVISRSGPARKD